MKSTNKLMLLPTAAVVLASMIIPSASGQQNSSGSGQRRGTASLERGTSEKRYREMQERQLILRMLEKQFRSPAERHEPQLALTQIREDFWHIQVVNKDVAQAVLSGASLDPKFIAKSAAEIKKRAGRLKYNLVLPEPEKGTKRPKAEVGAEPVQLKSSLSALGELILGFVNNPVFKSAGVVDAELSVKARRDLEGIIELSEGIKKSSEILNKVAQKSQ